MDLLILVVVIGVALSSMDVIANESFEDSWHGGVVYDFIYGVDDIDGVKSLCGIY